MKDTVGAMLEYSCSHAEKLVHLCCLCLKAKFRSILNITSTVQRRVFFHLTLASCNVLRTDFYRKHVKLKSKYHICPILTGRQVFL